MLKPSPVGIKPKEAGADMIKFVRQHYIHASDQGGPRVNEGSRKVLKRCNKTYATELDPNWWDERYKHTLNNFTCGAFSLPQYPYKSLGEIILDPNELVIDALAGSLPENFKRMYKKTDKDRPTDLATSWANVSHNESKARHPDGVGLYVSQHMEFNTAGMKQLKALLCESSLRIIATRGGQSYLEHVENAHNVKTSKIRKQVEAETPNMLVHRLSSQCIDENGAVPIRTENTKSKPATRKLRKLNQNVLEIRKKLVTLYQVLSALTNMRLKCLRSKQPMKISVLKILLKDPFAVDPMAGKTVPRHAIMRQVNQFRIKDSPGSQAERGSTRRESAYRTGKESAPSYPHSVSNQSSFLMQHQPTGSQANRFNQALVNTRPSKPFSSHSHSHSNRTADRRSRSKVHPNHFDDGSVKLEGWEDLLNVGVKNKQLRVLKPKQPPWQMLANQVEDSVSMKKSASHRKGDQLVNEDAEKVVNRTQQNFLSLKKKTYKNVTHEIEKLDKQRLIKYKYKMNVLDTMLPLFVNQQQLLADVGLSAATETMNLEKGTKWFSVLVKEVDSVTYPGLSYTTSMVNTIVLNKCLKRLKNFRKDEISLIPNVKEKLCLLTLSIPAYELCTQHMQNAIKFVLEEILHANVSLLNDWLDYRALPHFYTQTDD